MKSKNNRLDAIKMIISSKEIGSQDELLQELTKEGFQLTQATLSRDLKQLKVAKAASMNGNYVYVLPNNTMYSRMTEPHSATEMLRVDGIRGIEFSGNSPLISPFSIADSPGSSANFFSLMKFTVSRRVARVMYISLSLSSISVP